MGGDDSLEAPPELGPGILRPGEVVLHHWGVPGGRGVLTDQRCLFLSHPHPVHRSLRWSVDLEKIWALSVEGLGGVPMHTRGSGAGTASDGMLDPTFGVLVNEVPVYHGGPNPCADLQRRIDDARTARCQTLYGRLLPYHPGPTAEEPDFPVGGDLNAATPPGAAVPASVAAPFVLFIAGEPFKDAVPGAGHTVVMGIVARGGPGPGATFGGHEAADFDPGQIYGPQAEMARMVLDIAKRCGVSVKVVDVDHAGANSGLVQQYISPDDDLPSLVRYDGVRLNGSESIVPSKVEAFLRGR